MFVFGFQHLTMMCLGVFFVCFVCFLIFVLKFICLLFAEILRSPFTDLGAFLTIISSSISSAPFSFSSLSGTLVVRSFGAVPQLLDVLFRF